MTNQHPITPPPELVERLCNNVSAFSTAMPPLTSREIAIWLIEEAYVAGANQELEACCEWMKLEGHEHEHTELRAARRPKPPTLKEQALESVKRFELGQDELSDLACIRRALEALPND
jgi:hypothetical protein